MALADTDADRRSCPVSMLVHGDAFADEGEFYCLVVHVDTVAVSCSRHDGDGKRNEGRKILMVSGLKCCNEIMFFITKQ